MPSRPKLLAGPYRAPRCAAGEHLYCDYHQADVLVAGFSAGPIAWPAYAGSNGRQRHVLTPLLTGDLCRAVRVESAGAVAAWWGVSRDLVTDWRHALGVGRMTEGTRTVWRELAPRRLPREARRRGGRSAGALQRRRAQERRGAP